MSNSNESPIRIADATKREISAYTDGYESRFLQRGGEVWQAFEFRNFRHWFSPPQPLDPSDGFTPRETYHVPTGLIVDQELLHMSPNVLLEIGSQGRHA